VSKIKAERLHARRRALERYNLVLFNEDLKAIAQRINRGEGVMVRRQSLRVSVHELEVKGQRTLIVYDRQRHTPITFLPKEGLSPTGTTSSSTPRSASSAAAAGATASSSPDGSPR
jgi:hypothetical protein